MGRLIVRRTLGTLGTLPAEAESKAQQQAAFYIKVANDARAKAAEAAAAKAKGYQWSDWPLEMQNPYASPYDYLARDISGWSGAWPWSLFTGDVNDTWNLAPRIVQILNAAGWATPAGFSYATWEFRSGVNKGAQPSTQQPINPTTTPNGPTGGSGSTTTPTGGSGNTTPPTGGTTTPTTGGGTQKVYNPQITLTNLSNPGKVFTVGDRYLVEIHGGAPNVIVTITAYQNGNLRGTQNLGQTTANGDFSYSDVMAADTPGNWNETWKIGEDVRQLALTVIPKETPTTGTGTTTTGGTTTTTTPPTVQGDGTGSTDTTPPATSDILEQLKAQAAKVPTLAWVGAAAGVALYLKSREE